jgi:alkylation response protein AidB-like acyl-CoA dehydrogenase
MGMNSPVLDRPARSAALIGAEDEAITVARKLAGLFELDAASDLISRSGLLGVSVPTEHGGIDVSNTVLADICSILAEHSTALGAIVAAHFVAMEHVRSRGTEGQRTMIFSAALAGARLGGVRTLRDGGQEVAELSISPRGLGWRISGELPCTPSASRADWLLVPTRDNAGKQASMLLPTRIGGLHYVANDCGPSPSGASQAAERALFRDVPVEGDVLLHTVPDKAHPDVPPALELLLEASLQLGAGRRDFQRILHLPEVSAAVNDGDALAIGSLSVRLAAAEATIENAGRAIDAAQIGAADRHRVSALLAATTACVTSAEGARDARNLLGWISGRHAVNASRPNRPAHIDGLLRDTGRYRLETRDDEPDED